MNYALSRLKRSLCCCFALGALLGCEKEERPAKPNPTALSIPKDVSPATARKVAAAFDRLTAGANGRAGRRSAKAVRQTLTVPDSAGRPAFYIINYVDRQGFTIVSAEGRIQPILAFSDRGSFDLTHPNPGLSGWMKALTKAVQFFRMHPEQPGKPGVAKAWARYDGPLGYVPEDDPGPCDINLNVPSLLPTAWGQNSGYNHDCPAVSGGPCGRAVTGCAATAMAQVMRYHRQAGRAYSWETMPSRIDSDFIEHRGGCAVSAGEREVAGLMRQAGDAVATRWGADESTARGEAIEEAFENALGYSSLTDRRVFNPTTIKNEIDAGRPVLVDGDGHIWVAAGYRYYTIECIFGYLYLWMNWGWNERFDGFFSPYDWTPDRFDFTGRRAMILVFK